jgi:nicotinate-nucleotide pyrophosphorylase (carboxylating)
MSSITESNQIRLLLQQALQEDLGDGDHTSLSTIDANLSGTGRVKVKSNGLLAGVEVAQWVAEIVDAGIQCKIYCKDGSLVDSGDVVMELKGKVRSLLLAERLLLNGMQRMSGIATLTNKYVKAIHGTRCTILDTRKTTPNFRAFEKWAVRIGGGGNHRFGLFDMILIKDNHVDASGGIKAAITHANDYLEKTGKQLPIEIETRSLEEVKEVLEIGKVQRIMLDNFSPKLLLEAVQLINRRFETEASGGINLETIKTYAETGVDYISVGALTHSYHSLDISMKIQVP